MPYTKKDDAELGLAPDHSCSPEWIAPNGACARCALIYANGVHTRAVRAAARGKQGKRARANLAREVAANREMLSTLAP